jgi:hypothetical protein
VSSYFSSVKAGLYNVNSSPSYQLVNSAQDTGGKIPIILVHGLQLTDSIYIDNHPEQDTWKYFIEYFNSDKNKDLQGNFPLYTYRYDTTKSIDDNGADFATMITKYFPSQNVIIIAHSMVTCPPKTDPIFKLGLGYNKTDIKGGKRYEQEAIYDGADYWFTSGDGCKNFTGQKCWADLPGDRDIRTNILQMA